MIPCWYQVAGTVVKWLERNRQDLKGMEIKIAKSNIRKQVGGSLLSSILTLGRTLGPTVAKTLGLSTLAGLASEGASQVVKKISGRGQRMWPRQIDGQKVGFVVPHNSVDKQVAYKEELTEKQKRDLLNALQTGTDYTMRLTAR